MKTLLQLTTIFFLVITTFTLNAQSYNSHQLPTPQNLSPLFIGSIAQSNIYYGATPAGSDSKPVVVFVHGFVDLANLWFLPGNDIYDEAYDAGYRTAWVAMTRGEGMWANGALLANMLEDITAHYGVDNVVIVAHSNGGKASEVAMFHHNKYDLVSRVISLGTPFRGTQLADLAETFWFNWLVDFIGLGGGTTTSTTYYMDGYARPILDNDPDNDPSKFINLGGKGYKNGSTITAPVMAVGGYYIKYAGGGSNDGVTPYYSSTRPGGTTYWSGYNVPYIDHIDIAMDYKVWDDVEPLISNAPGADTRLAVTETPEFAHKTLTSNYQLLNGENGSATFTIEGDAGKVALQLMHEDGDANFSVPNQRVLTSTYESEDAIKGFVTELSFESSADKGRHTLESDGGRFMGILAYEEGAVLNVSNGLDTKRAYTEGESVIFSARIDNVNMEQAIVKAYVRMTSTLDGKAVNNANNMELDFEYNGEEFILNKANLEAGIYNIMIEAKGRDFTRHVVSGFVVNQRTSKEIDTVLANEIQLSNFPNPVMDNTTIRLNVVEENATTIRIFDAIGQVIYEEVFDADLGQFDTTVNLNQLDTGIYILEATNGQQKATSKLIKI